MQQSFHEDAQRPKLGLDNLFENHDLAGELHRIMNPRAARSAAELVWHSGAAFLVGGNVGGEQMIVGMVSCARPWSGNIDMSWDSHGSVLIP